MADKRIYSQWKQWQYYAIIGIISAVALFFLPMIGSEAGLAWRIPDTFVGWVVYITSKLLVATLNILIFHCFILQGKVNIENDEKYLEANQILERELNKKELAPKSPEQWSKQVYSKKGVTIFVTSILSAVGLTQAVLTFDWVSMLTYFFTVLMGIIFGILQMNATEDYWTGEYWQYAKNVEKANREAEERLKREEEERLKAEAERALAMAEAELLKQNNDCTDCTGGTDVLVTPDSDGVACSDCQS